MLRDRCLITFPLVVFLLLVMAGTVFGTGAEAGVKPEQDVACEVSGILYSEDNPSAIINGRLYYLNNSVCGGRIIDISEDNVKIKAGDREVVYTIKKETEDTAAASNLGNRTKKLKPKFSPRSALSSLFPKRAETINTAKYILYIPGGIDKNKKHPLVIALSPSADAKAMINVWRSVSEKHKWIILASKKFRNGIPPSPVFRELASALKLVCLNYPIDKSKIIVSGFSGGGMGSHLFAIDYPQQVSAVVVNSGGMHPYCLKNTDKYQRKKLAVFLASPADFNYEPMKRDRRILNNLDWKTKWIEFKGGHRIAPGAAYEKAAQWLEEQF